MDANENEFEFACIRVRSRLKLLGTGFKKNAEVRRTQRNFARARTLARYSFENRP